MIGLPGVVWPAGMACWAGIAIVVHVVVHVVIHVIVGLARMVLRAGVVRTTVAPHVSNAEDRGATVLLEQLAHTRPGLKGLHQFFHRHPTRFVGGLFLVGGLLLVGAGLL